MLNRFKELLDHLGLSASTFAEKIGVQRSSVSHILSGRNKPSVDFLEKIIGIFPQVNLEWLITGKGTWNKVSQESIPDLKRDDGPFRETGDMKSRDSLQETGENKKPARANAGPVDHIIIVYSDNSFRILDPAGGND